MVSSQKGFTLVEVIVVVVIISLILGFALPRIDSFLDEDRQNRSIRDLMILVKELRLKSQKLNKDHFLVISPMENSYWVDDLSDKKDVKKIFTGEDIYISGAQIPGYDFSRFKKVHIRFYKKGYNDPFIIVLNNRLNDTISSIYGHPFLYPPDIFDKALFLNGGLL